MRHIALSPILDRRVRATTARSPARPKTKFMSPRSSSRASRSGYRIGNAYDERRTTIELCNDSLDERVAWTPQRVPAPLVGAG